MERPRDLVLAGYHVKAIDGATVGQLWEQAHVHHPQALGLASIHHVYVCPPHVVVAPGPVDPSGVVELVHAVFLIFRAVLVQQGHDIIFALYKFFPNHASP